MYFTAIHTFLKFFSKIRFMKPFFYGFLHFKDCLNYSRQKFWHFHNYNFHINTSKNFFTPKLQKRNKHQYAISKIMIVSITATTHIGKSNPEIIPMQNISAAKPTALHPSLIISHTSFCIYSIIWRRKYFVKKIFKILELQLKICYYTKVSYMSPYLSWIEGPPPKGKQFRHQMRVFNLKIEYY